MFRQEVRALLQVGVHPHILRLLECFADGEEDILVLEYCEGGDIYELYAANNGLGMSELYVATLMRQLLLALDHLNRRGVEHRDVKPENLLLYGPQSDDGTPHLKLADFGWASIVGPSQAAAPVPIDGVGSLWYAPPELNPPVEGTDLRNGNIPIGRSDMWSVGIITYLLLVGHSPFNLALRITDPHAREAEVLRLAALGLVNTNARAWKTISAEAKQFIVALIQPVAATRMSIEEAWAHKFLSRHHAAGAEEVVRPPSALPSAADKAQIWRGIDGFQRLSWLAIARAVAEPELLEGPVFRNLIQGQMLGSATLAYLEQLAIELATTAVPPWFHANTAWADVLRLAFRYLDCDGDGGLGLGDLTKHVVSEDAEKVSGVWLLRWQGASQNSKSTSTAAIGFFDFRVALGSTLACKQRLEEYRSSSATVDGRAGTSMPTSPQPAKAVSSAELSMEEALRLRMSAIDEVCDQFVESDAVQFNFDMDDNSCSF